MKHYPFGSSTAARTDACLAWRQESAGVPNKESAFAIDGTITHGILEMFALDEACPDIVEGHKVEQSHREMAYAMWDDTLAVLKQHDMTEWEPEVTATTAEDVGGTLDLVAANTTTAMLLDYKTGMGVQVSPVNNKQILFATANMLYGDSPATDLVEGRDLFVGVIMQPNRAGEVETKVWEYTRDQVDAFWEKHQQNICIARDGGDLAPVAGDHCKFCPANGLCDATTGNLLRMAQLDPDDVEQLVWALDHIEAVKQTIKAVEKLAYEQLEVGQEIPGWKLVRGRPGNTSWDDPAAALKKLKRLTRGLRTEDDVRVGALLETKKMVSPTQAKKLLKTAGIEKSQIDKLDMLTHRPDAKGFTLAPESDKREAILSADALGAALNSIT